MQLGVPNAHYYHYCYYVRLGHTGIVDPSVNLSISGLKKYKKEWTETVKTEKYDINS